MKNTLIAIALLISGSAVAQTNYKTIMNPNKVKREKINLHLQKAKVLNGVGNGLALTAIASAVALYHLQGENSNGKAMIFVPLTIGGASLFTLHLAGRQEAKAENFK
jgi:hypothetical protein